MSVLSNKQSDGTYLLPAEVETNLFSLIKGHSSLAKLSGAEPLPFNGKETFTFDFDGDISIVGENAEKPAGSGVLGSKEIRPIKVVFQMRTSNEFMYATDEYKINVLQAFADGFAKKLAAGLDKMAFHGLDPKTKTASSIIGNNHIDHIAASNVVSYSAATADENIEDAIDKVNEAEWPVTGIAMSPACRTAIAKITDTNGNKKYPDFAFGSVPSTMGTSVLDVNATVSFAAASGTPDKAIVGDFQGCFRYGIAKNIPMKVIEYGDPDNTGKDLQGHNQVCLRGEAFIGWAFMTDKAFAVVQ